ncbi:hypothetical protein [Mesorhizobium sp. B4-1-1]|uniref:hypothetical protein n=1 Tax=Mesorhizobium sp. B4-1-1 TaxID=2589890 RepID=UPI00112B9C1B|nr:hypothetical protein [Mesorhizobium sp. B4-1-1]TPI13883.1 hypothetical protein FJW10_25760 [Mesorhizobium sp. B4-1-1]
MTRILLIALALAVAACMGVGLVAYHYKVAARDAVAAQAAAERDRDTAITVNKRQDEALGRLKAAKEKADQLAADLAEQVKTSSQALVDAAAERRTLENENDDIRKFLALRIPDALRLRDAQAVGHR